MSHYESSVRKIFSPWAGAVTLVRDGSWEKEAPWLEDIPWDSSLGWVSEKVWVGWDVKGPAEQKARCQSMWEIRENNLGRSL